MGGIEAHRKCRQVEPSKLCVSFSVNARRLIVCAKHICLAEINSDVCVLKFSTRRSLQKVLRTYKFKYAYSLKCLRVLTKVFTRTYKSIYAYLRMCLCVLTAVI